jgi:hypothetical protein
MFLYYQFTKEVWRLVWGLFGKGYLGLSLFLNSFQIGEPTTLGTSQRIPIFKCLWIALPKSICWISWLAGNKRIFIGEIANAKTTTMRAYATLSKYIRSRVHWKNQIMDIQEAKWLATFQLETSPQTISNTFIKHPKMGLTFVEVSLPRLETTVTGSNPYFQRSITKKPKGGRCVGGRGGVQLAIPEDISL